MKSYTMSSPVCRAARFAAITCAATAAFLLAALVALSSIAQAQEPVDFLLGDVMSSTPAGFYPDVGDGGAWCTPFDAELQDGAYIIADATRYVCDTTVTTVDGLFGFDGPVTVPVAATEFAQ